MQSAGDPPRLLDRLAMASKHSIVRAALRRGSIVRVRTVLLIVWLAMGCRFVILDAAGTPAPTMAALGFVTGALAACCWLLRCTDAEAPASEMPRRDAAVR